MCGPIAFALPLSRDHKIKMFGQLSLYHIGRILTYSFIGVLFGFFGKGLYLAGFQQRLSILIGVIMILAILFPALLNFSKKPNQTFYKLVSFLKQRMAYYLPRKNFASFFMMGFLNGFLPCGLVYMAVFGAIASGNTLDGATYMAMFGLGTVALMSLAALLGNFVNISFRNKIQKAIPIFVVIIGLLFVLRGLGLGIPYISPSDVKLNVGNNATECVTDN
jgi:sulfite exporter TauE/SafE